METKKLTHEPTESPTKYIPEYSVEYSHGTYYARYGSRRFDESHYLAGVKRAIKKHKKAMKVK